MLDNLLNSIAFTIIVAIAAAAASDAFHASAPKGPGEHAKLVAYVATTAAQPTQPITLGADAAVPAAESPATIVQLPTVVVVGKRERTPGPTSIAAAN